MIPNRLETAAQQALTLDDLKVLRKAARCLQWAIQTESFLEKVAPGGRSNEKDYCDAAEGLKSICEKYSTAPQPAEQDLAELIDALKKFRGLPPHNSTSNPCQGDGYFYAGIEAKYTPEQIAAANVALDTSTKPAAEPAAWQPIESAPKDGRKVILFYLNSNNKARTVMARWLTDEEAAETDGDGVGLNGGWYECIDNWGDYTEVAIHEGDPSHWMHLPKAPAARSITMSNNRVIL